MTNADTLRALQAQVTDLTRKLARALGEDVIVTEDDLPAEQRPDYIEFGSEAHAALLGLKKAQKDDPEIYVINEWTLMDIATPLLSSRGSKEYVRELLRQKVTSLISGAPAIPQSESRLQPYYAPPLWEPSPADR